MIAHGVWRGCNVAMAESHLYIERQDKPNLVGGIVRGKVDRIIGKAAFVKLPGSAMGYLDKAKNAKLGDEILVQVSGYASDGKAWPLSTELKLQSRAFIYLPNGKGIAVSKKLDAEAADTLKAWLSELVAAYAWPGGWIIRSLADRDDAATNEAEAARLVEKAKLVAGKSPGWLIAPPSVLERAQAESVALMPEPLDEDDLEEKIAPLLQSDIALPGGGRIRLCPTPALFTIDVDAGASTNPRQLGEEAADAIASAIRSRAIGGQIVIDPLRASETFLDELFLALMHDRLSVTLYGRTKMGLIELSRPRFGPSLFEVLK